MDAKIHLKRLDRRGSRGVHGAITVMLAPVVLTATATEGVEISIILGHPPRVQVAISA